MFKVILLETLRFAHKLFIPLLLNSGPGWKETRQDCVYIFVSSQFYFEHLFRGN